LAIGRPSQFTLTFNMVGLDRHQFRGINTIHVSHNTTDSDGTICMYSAAGMLKNYHFLR